MISEKTSFCFKLLIVLFSVLLFGCESKEKATYSSSGLPYFEDIPFDELPSWLGRRLDTSMVKVQEKEDVFDHGNGWKSYRVGVYFKMNNPNVYFERFLIYTKNDIIKIIEFIPIRGDKIKGSLPYHSKNNFLTKFVNERRSKCDHEKFSLDCKDFKISLYVPQKQLLARGDQNSKSKEVCTSCFRMPSKDLQAQFSENDVMKWSVLVYVKQSDLKVFN